VEKDEDVIGRFLEAIEAGAMPGCDALGEGAVLDATVPNWRFTVSGGDAVRGELARWYGDPGTFEELVRTPVPGGELVRFTRRWEEDGTPHAAHQAHLVTVRDGRIARDEVWCGGRWPAALLAEMAEAGQASQAGQ
jgi:ketosteroid isomerase-like protein